MKTNSIKKQIEILNTPLTKKELSQPINGTWKNVTRDQVINITSVEADIVQYYWNGCRREVYDYMTTKEQLLRCYTKIN